MVAQCSQTLFRLWVVDTGCPYDLTSKVSFPGASPILATEQVCLHTANGSTKVEHAMETAIRELQRKVTPYLLDNTPDVLSFGYRTVRLGYSFVWMAGERPALRLPDGAGMRVGRHP